MTDMRCIVCNSPTEFYFSKQFHGELDLQQVDYVRCTKCRLVEAKSLFDLSNAEWQKLNYAFHSSYQGTDVMIKDTGWLPRLEAQCRFLTIMREIGAVSTERPWLDWGAGDAKLSGLLAKNGIKLSNYDRYMKNDNFLTEADLTQKKFGLVVSTSVLEHIRDASPICGMQNLVAEDGAFGFHTNVQETIPRDPSWFYFLTVHTVFYTNAAMQILFKRGGYRSSIYHIPSDLWLWFKDKRGPSAAREANRLSRTQEFLGANAFVEKDAPQAFFAKLKRRFGHEIRIENV